MSDHQQPPASIPPIFVVGCPRSGTTMLSALLQHTVWGEPFETHFIPKYYSRLDRYGDLSHFANFERLMQGICSERPVLQWQLPLDVRAFFESLDCYEYGHIVDRFCRLHTARQGLPSWGDKTPFYATDLSTIHRLFPHSKIIHITRDGRDVALSLMRTEWGPANIYTCAKLWNRCNRPSEIVDTLEQAGLYHMVRYEDLLDQPDIELREILSYLGQTCDEKNLRKLTADVRRSNQGKWKTELSNHEAGVFEAVAGKTLARLDYPTTGRPISLGYPRKMAYLMHERVHLVRHLFYANVIESFQIRFLSKEPFAD